MEEVRALKAQNYQAPKTPKALDCKCEGNITNTTNWLDLVFFFFPMFHHDMKKGIPDHSGYQEYNKEKQTSNFTLKCCWKNAMKILLVQLQFMELLHKKIAWVQMDEKTSEKLETVEFLSSMLKLTQMILKNSVALS